LGILTLSAIQTTVMHQDSSLFMALPEMAKAGGGGAVVLVCHAYQQGLLLPVAPNGKSVFAETSALAIIDQAIAAEAEAKNIRALPRTNDAEKKIVLDRWSKLIDSLQRGAISGEITEKDAEAFYAKWIDMVSKKLEFGTVPPFRQLLDRVLRLRAVKLSRLELRACNVGGNGATLETLRKFFAVDHITAPILGTFYATTPVNPMIPQGAPRGVRGSSRAPGPVRDQGLQEAKTARDLLADATTRGFVGKLSEPLESDRPLWARRRGVRPFFDVDDITISYRFILRIVSPTAFHYRLSAWVTSAGTHLTQDWSVVQTFVAEQIMRGSSFQRGLLPLAGLWNPGVRDQPFILPLEQEYTKNIAQSPAASPSPKP
jgi:hypothetical protein